MSVNLIVSGYLQHSCSPCASAGQCTFGCGKTPRSLCVGCYKGVGILTDWIPIVGVEDDPDCLCDMCGNLF